MFRRRGAQPSQSESASPELPALEWTLATVRAEWQATSEEQDTVLAWQNGMRLFDQGVVPGQWSNVAEYMTRALRAHLLGSGPISEEDVPESVRRVIEACERVPQPDPYAAFTNKYARLALAITKDRSWQPIDLGGSATVRVVDNGATRRALAARGVNDDVVVSRFFVRPES